MGNQSQSVENPELLKLPVYKPGAGQNIAFRTSPATRISASVVSAFPVHSTFFFFFADPLEA